MVRNHDRQRENSPPDTMDMTLLSSPQLVSLDYTLFSDFDPPEVEQLAEALTAGAHCKSLRVHIGAGWHELPTGHFSSEGSVGEVTNPTFPLLEEFSIIMRPDSRYSHDPYRLLRGCIEATSLKRLDLDDSCTLEIFGELVGRTPNLRYLRFGVPGELHVNDSVTSFLDSLVDLCGLNINNIGRHTNILWPFIQKHRHSLKELILRPTKRSHWGRLKLAIDYLQVISENFTALEHLGFDIPFASSTSSPDDDTHVRVLISK